VAFLHRVPGLAFLHRLVIAWPLACVEMGACRDAPGVPRGGPDGSPSVCRHLL